MKIHGGEDQSFLYEVPEAIYISSLPCPGPTHWTPAEGSQCRAVRRKTMTDRDKTLSHHQPSCFKICGVISVSILKQEMLEASLIFWNLWWAVTEELCLGQPQGCTGHRIQGTALELMPHNVRMSSAHGCYCCPAHICVHNTRHL